MGRTSATLVALLFVGCATDDSPWQDGTDSAEDESVGADADADGDPDLGADTTGDTGADADGDAGEGEAEADSEVEVTCDSRELLCDGACIDPNTDPDNCGACGTVCPLVGADCVLGRCECLRAGDSLCDGECVQLGTDENCGGCGDACDTSIGLACIGGACACPAPLEWCGSDCRQIGTTADCESCGDSCLGLAVCESSGCVCHEYLCPHTGDCVDTDTDENNCGECGRRCSTWGDGLVCERGDCYCPAGLHLDCTSGRCICY